MDTNSKTCFVFDLDGTVYLGDAPIQGTIDFIRRNQERRDSLAWISETERLRRLNVISSQKTNKKRR